MQSSVRVATAPCPGCGQAIKLGPRPREGQHLRCANCGDELEIINLEPPELDWVFNDFELDEEEWEEDSGLENEITDMESDDSRDYKK